MLDAFRDQKSKSDVLNSTTQTPIFVVKFMETECMFVFLRRDFYEGE